MTDIWPKHASKLAGVWELRSYDLYDGFGPSKKFLRARHGDAPFGRTVITSTGFLSAHLTPPEAAQPLSTDKDAFSALQLASAVLGVRGDAEVVRAGRGE
jgi:hypothetical protein